MTIAQLRIGIEGIIDSLCKVNDWDPAVLRSAIEDAEAALAPRLHAVARIMPTNQEQPPC